jgi:hypothetical protein
VQRSKTIRRGVTVEINAGKWIQALLRDATV